MTTTKTLYVAIINNNAKGIFTNEQDIPKAWLASYEPIVVDFEKWDEGKIDVTNFRKHIMVPQTTFTREEVETMLVNMYVTTAESYDEYDRTTLHYTDQAIVKVKQLMSMY